MDVDWITVLLVAVCVVSLWRGARRGLVYEPGSVFRQVGSIAAGLLSFCPTWGSEQNARFYPPDFAATHQVPAVITVAGTIDP